MNLELKIKWLCEVDPKTDLKCDVDGFIPYVYFEIDDEFDAIREWIEQDFLDGLQKTGIMFVVRELKELKKELNDKIDLVLLA